MQKSSVNKLLNKKVWTGEEVGRAILIRLVDDLARPDQPPTITQADIDRMHSSLNTSAQRATYSFFSTLYDTLYDLGNMQRTSAEFFYHGHYLEQTVLASMTAENVTASQKCREPVLLTPEHFAELEQECLEKLKATKADYWCAFYNVLLHIEEWPFKAQLAWDECVEEPITNESLLSYIEENGLTEVCDNKQTIFYTDAMDYYFSNPQDEEAAFIMQHYLEFREDYPKLTKEIDKYLHTFPAFKDIRPVEDCFNVVASFEELAEQGFPAAQKMVQREKPSLTSVKDYLIHDKEGYSTEYKVKVMCGGIALTLEGEEAETPADYHLDELDNVVDVSEAFEDAIPSIQMARYALKSMYAFNAVVDVLIKCYGLDIIEDLKNNMQEFEEKVEENSDIIRKLKNCLFGTEEEKAEKLQKVETAFPIINVEDLQPDPDRIAVLEEMLEKATLSTGSNLVKRNAIAHYMLYLMGDREEAAYGK